ncbi:hypothetical protein, partial [Streptomyces sp. URMC 123]|uniref:hypothetical protein n=1 Tax=Streptomyces sp. URMC 123 TaxID=3423403 RepID=UPI003F1B1DBD
MTPWATADTSASADEDRSVALPETVFAPPLAVPGADGTGAPAARPEAKTTLLSGGSALPPES